MKKWGQHIFVCGLLLFFAGVVATLLDNDFIAAILLVPSIPCLAIGGWLRIFDVLHRAWKFLTDKRWT
jgi:hypothetical protein